VNPSALCAIKGRLKERDVTTRIDEASRVIRARPERIYQAFESSEALESWLPPEGMTGRVLSFSFREGGGYRMRVTYHEPSHPSAKTTEDSDEAEVRFLKLAASSRIEQVVEFDSEEPEFAGSMKMTWSFEGVDEGTKVTVRCEDVPEGIRPEDHQAGLTSTLENLANFTE
jgi:uncharacterized protein YndB with AHSA1/START domain